ncbi:MAG: YihY family inner membrane protein [Gammaproteobacteria bacterium]
MSIINTIKTYSHSIAGHFLFVFRHFFSDECLYRASALTFTSLLAVVPCMSVGFAILAAFPVFDHLRTPIEDFIFSNFVPATGEIIQAYLTSFIKQAAGLSVWGTLFLLATVVLVMFTVERAMNQIWRVRAGRKGMVTVLLYWAVFSLAPVFMGTSFVVSSYLASLPLLSEAAQSFGINKGWLLAWAPFALLVVTFTLLYVAVPNCKVKFSHGFIGAVVAALLIECAKISFALYLTSFNTYELIYGAFATIPLLFLWIYWVWVIVLLGAELAHGLSAYYDRRHGPRMDGFSHAFHWLGYLWQAQQQGYGLTLQALIARDEHNYEVTPDNQLDVLLKAKLVVMIQDDKIMLSRDLSRLTLSDVFHQLPWHLPDEALVRSFKKPWDDALATVIADVSQAKHTRMAQPLADFYAS